MSRTPRGSFKVVYKEIALPLTKFIVKRAGGNKDMVDEVFSRTVEAAWRGYNTFEHKSKFFTWVCRIALNKMADYYRTQVNKKSKLVVPIIENIVQTDDSTTPEETYALEELRQNVRACINLLPYDSRRLLYLKYWKDLTYEQIGKVLGISERAVEGRLYRAKTAFEKLFGED